MNKVLQINLELFEMQRPKTTIRKKTTDKDSQAAEQSFPRHWDSWIVPDKFNLRDWYYLTQEENEDLDLLLLTEATTNVLLDNYLISYVNKSVISYTLHKFQQDILNNIFFIKIYPNTLRNTKEITDARDRFDCVEPVLSPIDAHSCGWPFPIYDPNFNVTKLNQNTREEQIQTAQSQNQGEERSHRHSKVGSLKDFSEVNLFAHRVIRKSTNSGHLPTKKRFSVAFMNLPKRLVFRKSLKLSETSEEMNSHIDEEDDDDDEREKISKARFKTSNESAGVQTMSRTISKSEIGSSGGFMYRQHRQLPVASHSGGLIRKVRLTREGTSSTGNPASFEFDHLEPSNFANNRTKTGFTIKDVEVPKELTKPQPMKRATGILRRGSEQTTRTAIVATPSSSNILIMPSVLDKMTNLGGGVIARKEEKPKIPNVFSHEQQEVRPLLKPISRSKVEPRLLISQIVDRRTPSTNPQTILNKK